MMNQSEKVYRTDVIIAGGGPVGLYLAARLLHRGIRAVILEKRQTINRHSKSLGIHPVSLELFEAADMVQPFLEEGLKIEEGVAFSGRDKIGELRFKDHLAPPYNFILAIPQYRTEEILENRVLQLQTGALKRGATITDINQTDDRVAVSFEDMGGTQLIEGKYLVGCDGKRSLVRSRAGILYTGNPYPDTYVMGDFDDETPFGNSAAVYLHEDGLIESFPLPGSRRRWVAKTSAYQKRPAPNDLREIVRERIGYSLKDVQNHMISSFGVQHHLADPFYKGRILLAGDAAHVVSPIGGQGMNLGWLTANDASAAIELALHHPRKQESIFRKFSYQARSRAKKVGKRAEINMRIGRAHSYPEGREWLARALVNSPLSKVAANVFAMRYL